MTDNELLATSEGNRQKALSIIRRIGVTEAFARAGGEAHIVGSVAMGLIMTHRDIDIHAYTTTLTAKGSFAVMADIAECPGITRMECRNLITTDEACMEWHAWYADENGHEWQIDIMHILKGSRYDGYFERVADRIARALTDETRRTILRLTYDTPDDEKVMGIEYYQAVIAGGVSTWQELVEWRKAHPVTGIVSWMPPCRENRP